MKEDIELQNKLNHLFDLAWDLNNGGNGTELSRKVAIYLPDIMQQLGFYSQTTEFVVEMIKEASKEAQEYKDANQFCRGVAFAYRCVLNMLKDFGGIESETKTKVPRIGLGVII